MKMKKINLLIFGLIIILFSGFVSANQSKYEFYEKYDERNKECILNNFLIYSNDRASSIIDEACIQGLH